MEDRRKLLSQKMELAMRVTPVKHAEFRDRLRGRECLARSWASSSWPGILEHPKDPVLDESAMRNVVMVSAKPTEAWYIRKGTSRQRGQSCIDSSST
jgi:hypothetical protein